MTNADETTLLARATIYRFLSGAFMGRETGLEEHQKLRMALAHLGVGLPGLLPQPLDPPLAIVHARLFGHNLTPDCPPYEASYEQTNIFQQTQVLADLAGFYRAFGLDVADTAHERGDHMAVESEFMAYLCLKEWHARRSGYETNAQICRDAQRKFLSDHLGRWASAFAQALKRKAANSPYAGIANVLDTFVRAECARLGAIPSLQWSVQVAPTPVEGTGCSSCVFATGDQASQLCGS